MRERLAHIKRDRGATKRLPTQVTHRDNRLAEIKGHEITDLQRLIGNREVTRLLSGMVHRVPESQPEGEMAGASKDKLDAAVKETIDKIAKKKPDKLLALMRRDLLNFEKTGELIVRTFSAAVMSRPRFFIKSEKISTLKRGDRIATLGLKGAWCRVKFDDGRLGWVHRNHLLPRFLGPLSSKDKINIGGSSRDEVEIGGRG